MALHLWVLSPLVPSDASTIVETLARSMEAANSQFRSLGKAMPKQTLVWAPWLFHKAVFAYVSAIHPDLIQVRVALKFGPSWHELGLHLRLIIACERTKIIQS